MRWERFREEFADDYLADFSTGYVSNVECTLNVIEDLMEPDTLARITEKWLTRFHSLVKKRKVKNATVRKYFQHLKTALNWALEQKYLKTVPTFPKQTRQTQKGGRLMKGRPVTGEEFDRMVAVTESESLKRLLNGLWLSGLRLGEALNLTWDEWADGIRVMVDSDGDVCLMIDGANQKNGESIVYPLVDDFADFLMETPQDQREGFVFNPQRKEAVSRRVDTVSNWLVDIGKLAGVKVDDRDGVEKFASAHDLRRAFGTRWAKIVPPAILRQLMRHANIETTMAYYVNITAKDTLAEVRRHVQKGDRVTKSPDEVTNEVTNIMETKKGESE